MGKLITTLFKNRAMAAGLLAEKLKQYRNDATVIVSLPQGGIAVGCRAAALLSVPFDIFLTDTIIHPEKPGSVIGWISLNSRIYKKSACISCQELDSISTSIRKSLSNRYQSIAGNRKSPNLNNKTIVLVDDGLTPINSLLVALELLRKSTDQRVIVAVPATSADQLLLLTSAADEVLFLKAITNKSQPITLYEQNEDINDPALNALIHSFDEDDDQKKLA